MSSRNAFRKKKDKYTGPLGAVVLWRYYEWLFWQTWIQDNFSQRKQTLKTCTSAGAPMYKSTTSYDDSLRLTSDDSLRLTSSLLLFTLRALQKKNYLLVYTCTASATAAPSEQEIVLIPSYCAFPTEHFWAYMGKTRDERAGTWIPSTALEKHMKISWMFLQHDIISTCTHTSADR